jgi:hypothetical protein
MTDLAKLSHLGRPEVGWASYYEHVRLGEQPLPAGLLALLESRRLFTNVRWQEYVAEDQPDREDVEHLGQAEAASSQRRDDLDSHAIMFDIDHHAEIRGDQVYVEIPGDWYTGRRWVQIPIPLGSEAWLIPSTQPRHYHLYIDVDWPWDRIERLLDRLARDGAVEPGYRQVSIKRGFTALRLPWVAKEDAAAALASTVPQEVAF